MPTLYRDWDLGRQFFSELASSLLQPAYNKDGGQMDCRWPLGSALEAGAVLCGGALLRIKHRVAMRDMDLVFPTEDSFLFTYAKQLLFHQMVEQKREVSSSQGRLRSVLGYYDSPQKDNFGLTLDLFFHVPFAMGLPLDVLASFDLSAAQVGLLLEDGSPVMVWTEEGKEAWDNNTMKVMNPQLTTPQRIKKYRNLFGLKLVE